METLSLIIVSIAVAIVALLTLAMLFYQQLLIALAWILHWMFLLGLVLAVSSIAYPSPHRWLSLQWLETTGVVAQLRLADGWWREIEALPDTIWRRVRSPFSSEEEPPPTPLAPPPGPLETGVIPELVDVLGFGLRLLGFSLGVTLMCVGLIYRSATDLVLQVRALRRRVEVLEALDAAVSAPSERDL